MTNNATPAPPGDIDPRHVFLTAKEVILRYGWGRTYGYLMLRSTGFPRRIGDRFRLDTLIAWEQAVLAGELPGLAVTIFRLPLKAYQHNAGPAVGRTFLAFTHMGRKTGHPHQTVAMVARYDKATGEAVICTGWGPQTDWYRNLQARPATTVQLGGRTFTPQQRFLTAEEAFDVIVQFRREHPHRLRFFSRVLGWGDLRDDAAGREFVRTHPFVAFRPAADAASAAEITLEP
jgi:deazaflavin-dependent oxidoreductase (nitroreductase family)